MNSKWFVLGGGGHAKVLIDILKFNANVEITGYSALNPSQDNFFENLNYYPADFNPDALDHNFIKLVNGIGSVGDQSKRKNIYVQWTEKGFKFPLIIHPQAVVSTSSNLTDGVQVMAGAIIQPGCRIGSNAIINTRSVIEHDCFIGNHVHVSPGAVLCGNVIVEDESHIGAGAVIRQGIRVGKGSVVGAGAVVIKDVPPGITVAGVPAKEVSRR